MGFIKDIIKKSLGDSSENNSFQLGDAAPTTQVLDDQKKTVNLAEEAAEGFTLVYFYPKADTPGCTAQACSLRDHYDVLTKRGVKVFGVSTDKPEAQAKFKEKYDLPFRLLADVDRMVLEAFGVRTMMGFASRQAFLFKDGKAIWIDRNASTKQQAVDVLKILNEES